MRLTLSALVLALFLTTATAQTASFDSYSRPCGSSVALSITGLPKLGTTFTVHRVRFPGGCTRRYCGCNVGPCNTCSGSLLVFGIRRINAPLPGGCRLYVDPLVILPGDTRGQVVLAVPNLPVLNGAKFHLQRADVGTIETIDSNCAKSYPITKFFGLSDAVTGTIGR